MSEIIAIANQKGGVGKSTTSINLSAAIAHCGQDCLIIDLDPQGNTTSGLGLNKSEVTHGIYNNLVEQTSPEKTIKGTSVELLDIIPSSVDMIGAEMELADLFSRETRMRETLKSIKNSYSFIIIDCPPSLGLLTINALAAANSVLIPIQGEYYALEGLAQFIEAVKRIQESLNPGLKVEGGVLTMFDPRFTLAVQVKNELGAFFGDSLFKTYIPRTVRLAEAPGFGKTIFQYDPRSKGSESYLSLAGELLTRRGWKGMRLN
ncbi:MAG: AAA family ATPase [Elusimicrobiota bacterium]